MTQYYVYIMADRSKALCTGVTDDLQRRVYEHKRKLLEGFTKLVYYETSDDGRSAVKREKQIKGWLRSRKVALIRSVNPVWRDLSDGWHEAEPDPSLRSG